MGDLNAKVDQKSDGEILGNFELVTRNEGGEKWAHWYVVNEQLVSRTPNLAMQFYPIKYIQVPTTEATIFN